MARATFESWIPEEYNSGVIQKIKQVSAVEAKGRHIGMTSETKSVPRSGGVSIGVVAKGAAYGEDVTANDEVVLAAAKLATAVRIAEEDIDDSLANILETKKLDWATSYGKFFDNATLAVTAVVGTGVPFTSVYNSLATASTGYAASANIVTLSAAAPTTTYAKLSSVLGIVEGGDYFDESRVNIIAHPLFRGVLRGVLDTTGAPIFVQGLAGTPDTLFGIPITWSMGARTSATATATPTGNPILVVANTDLLLVGDRTNAESVFIDGRSGASALTDEAILKLRARKAFQLGAKGAAAVLEYTA